MSQKNDPLGWHPGPGKLGQKGENMPNYDVTHRNPKLKTKKNFPSEIEDLPIP